MIFMTKKNCIEFARFLGRLSFLYENAGSQQKRTIIAEELGLAHVQILDAFLEAKEHLKATLAMQSNKGGASTGNGGD